MKIQYIFILLMVVAFPRSSHATDTNHFIGVMQDVLANHPTVQAEEATLKAAAEGVSEATSGFFPSVIAGYYKGRRHIEYDGFSPRYEDTGNKELVVTQPIFNGGETIAQIGAADARFNASAARLRLVKQEVLLNTATAYVDVIEKQELLQLTQENMDVLTSYLDGAKIQFSAGELTITDVAQSKARLARVNAELHDVKAALASAYATYVREIGQESTAVNLPPLPQGFPQTQEELLVFLPMHPAVMQARYNKEAADRTIDTRFAALLPDISLQGLVRDSEPAAAPALSVTEDRSLTLRVSIPLYQSGAEYARLRQARHKHTQAHSQAVDVSRRVRENALSQWHAFRAAGEVITSYEEAIAAAEQALNGVRIEQAEGTRTVLDVLDIQEGYFSNRINLTRAKARQTILAYQLLVAMGILDQLISPPAA